MGVKVVTFSYFNNVDLHNCAFNLESKCYYKIHNFKVTGILLKKHKSR